MAEKKTKKNKTYKTHKHLYEVRLFKGDNEKPSHIGYCFAIDYDVAKQRAEMMSESIECDCYYIEKCFQEKVG